MQISAPVASNGHVPVVTPPVAEAPGPPHYEVHQVTGLSDRSAEGVRFLVVDDDARNLFAMGTLLESCGADVTVVESGAEAIVALDETPGIDIVLMDIMMPVMDGYDTIRAIRRLDRFKSLTVIAVTGKVMAGERMRCMDAGANDYVPKPVDVSELFGALRPWLPQAKREEVAVARSAERVLEGILIAADSRPPFSIGAKTLEGLRVLVVDDDFRNIFAMTAILERGNAVVTSAESGAEAVAALELAPDTDIVLMDIMMPVMDGYDTIRAIRQMAGFEALPIVAVTGKAAAGERQRCLESGANDYIPKPVDTGVLLAALAPWIPAARTPVTS